MNKNLSSNIILILLLLVLVSTIVYGVTRLEVEGVQCVANPIKYYQELHNVTVPWQITAPPIGIINPFLNIST